MARKQKSVTREKATHRLHCNQCRGMTYHTLLKEVDHKDSEAHEEQYLLWWHTRHEMFQCCGCKSVTIRRTHMFSEWDEPDVQFFPPSISRHKPDWFYKLPRELRALLDEVYNSLNSDTRALPLMGARAVLDLLIVDKVGDVGSFAEKLEKLENHGYISKKNREVLDAALDAGNAAAHRGYAPKLEEVHSVMDIVENLVHATYVLDKVANEIKKTTPPRPIKPKAARRTNGNEAAAHKSSHQASSARNSSRNMEH